MSSVVAQGEPPSAPHVADKQRPSGLPLHARMNRVRTGRDVHAPVPARRHAVRTHSGPGPARHSAAIASTASMSAHASASSSVQATRMQAPEYAPAHVRAIRSSAAGDAHAAAPAWWHTSSMHRGDVESSMDRALGPGSARQQPTTSANLLQLIADLPSPVAARAARPRR
jgi:hypothetical protein